MIRKMILPILLTVSSYLGANVNAVVSIMPQKTFVEAIGGDKVNITLMVKPGSSPHTYEPKPSQMKDISKADIYFSIGVEFEEVWLAKFQNQNKEMKIVNSSKGIDKIAMVEHVHSHDKHEEHKEHKEHTDHKAHKDPHVWTDPENVKIIAQNIYNALIRADKENSKYYKENFDKFIEHIDKTDKQIKDIIQGRELRLMVFHPAWGYYCKRYGLKQIPIEVEGKNPKPKMLMHIISQARKEKVNVIFTSPEFSDVVAKKIAGELGIPVVKISPLARDWSSNLINLTKQIVR
ncbi:MAG: zinc ABC transporter solute-binding protein [Sulfurovum sp.]|nr:zinc ABC transporter solute-binding protein [Sulfurovum sp.]